MYRQNFSTPKKHHKQSFLKISRIYIYLIEIRFSVNSPPIYVYGEQRGSKSYELRRQEKDERTRTKQKSYEDLRWVNLIFFLGTCGVFGVRFLT